MPAVFKGKKLLITGFSFEVLEPEESPIPRSPSISALRLGPAQGTESLQGTRIRLLVPGVRLRAWASPLLGVPPTGLTGLTELTGLHGAHGPGKQL